MARKFATVFNWNNYRRKSKETRDISKTGLLKSMNITNRIDFAINSEASKVCVHEKSNECLIFTKRQVQAFKSTRPHTRLFTVFPSSHTLYTYIVYYILYVVYMCSYNRISSLESKLASSIYQCFEFRNGLLLTTV